ncbi:ferredoxin family protein [Candidatus Eisenbacteria bacterium]|uniref:Ferredoxin family protein n=1 Tax=Eiseniibacteriota bacterium TaxID=2212470 RepID=A0ABV6YID5_UNCEI
MRFWRTPLDDENFTRHSGRIHIIVERCKGCAFCVEYCPRGVIEISEKFNKKGYHYPVAIRENACVDCDLCETICPEFAIYSERIEGVSAKGEEPAEEVPNEEGKKEAGGE